LTEPVRIAVVILNWNGAPLTIECLGSIRTASGFPKDVVVVDNDSGDDSVKRIQDWANEKSVSCLVTREGALDNVQADVAWLTIIRADRNRGFAAGNNLGIKFLLEQTVCSHILLLNNDAMAAPGFFDELRKALTLVPDAGLLTGTIYEDHDDRTTVWYAGGIEIPYRALTAHLREVPHHTLPVPTQFVCGCAMLISRRVLETVGSLAECYSPVYGEDAEYSLRVREAGFPLIYAPRAIAYHLVGATVGPAKDSPLVTYCQIRHRVFFVRRNYRGWKRIVAMSYLVATKPGRALFEILKGNPRIGSAILRGFANGMVSPAARVG
jgi:GT2 family glycosyltransferase